MCSKSEYSAEPEVEIKYTTSLSKPAMKRKVVATVMRFLTLYSNFEEFPLSIHANFSYACRAQSAP